jgi:hypothetical protein
MAQQVPASVMIYLDYQFSVWTWRESPRLHRFALNLSPSLVSKFFKQLIKHSGSLAIAENCTGSFELNGVQNITGYLMATSTDPDAPEVLWLTSVETPDLVALSNLLMHGLLLLRRFLYETSVMCRIGRLSGL